MKTLVVYDTLFGNTGLLARVIANRLPNVTLVHVDSLTPEHIATAELIFLGSPSRGYNATKKLRQAIEALPKNALKEKSAAVFETRLKVAKHMPRILRYLLQNTGWGDAKLDTVVLRKGAKLISPLGLFYVSTQEGPLKEGETDKAALWAKQIHAYVSTH
jgi:menaquinone-dependent protoporphyrinogen IX oxidase